jgi:acetylornithine deacetylase/succinyl-diaminopimelate desuccinylase family protein
MSHSDQFLLEWIDAHQDEIMRIASDLIRIPSVSSQPDATAQYERVVAYLRGELERLGVDGEEYRARPDAGPNLIARFPGRGAGPTVALGGHTDVVVANEPDWVTGSGFEPREIDGKLYGRGAADMKGGLAACLVAIRALRSVGVEYCGQAVLVACVDEEVGGENGMRHLVESGALTADAVINAEQTGLEIKTAYKGTCWLRVIVHGRTAHGSTPEQGVNAIYKAAGVIQTVYGHRFTATPHPMLGSCTVNVGTIVGGDAKNVVPARCEFTLDIRMVPGQTAEGVLQEVRALVQRTVRADATESAEVVFDGRQTRPIVMDESAPLVRALSEAGEIVLGRRPRLGGFISAGDMWHFLARGVPALMCGPGRLEQIHRANEFATSAELVNAAKIYALTLERLLAQ